jgi:hypothetical protein
MKVGERLETIMPDVQRRKLLYPLTAQQISNIAALGGRREFLTALQQPGILAPREVSDAVVARKALARETLAKANPDFAKRVAAFESRNAPVPESAPPGTPITPNRKLVIEKLVVLQEPFHLPFYLYFSASANNGLVSAAYHQPGQTYRLEGMQPRAEVPLGLVLYPVHEGEWANVILQLDTDDQLVTTNKARKSHNGRIPITNSDYIGAPYEFNPPHATFIVSDKTDQEFKYQVYWHVE